jgi:hypothetical protein
MSNPQASFVGARSQTLAALWLTQHRDLRVLDQEGDFLGFDLLVAVATGGRFTGRQFGVIVKPQRSGTSGPRLTAAELRRDRARLADLTIPVCMLAFPASGEPGWFRWVLEPVGCDGTALEFTDRIGFAPATSELLAHVVDQVNHWFDMRRVAA